MSLAALLVHQMPPYRNVMHEYGRESAARDYSGSISQARLRAKRGLKGAKLSKKKEDASALLAAWHKGDDSARDKLYALIYPELISIARSALKRHRNGVSLNTGDLLHNACIKFFGKPPDEINDKEHLLALAARAMKQVLLDHHKRNKRSKRNGARIELKEDLHGSTLEYVDMGKMDRALIRLRTIQPEWADMVEMRYFGGMTNTEMSEVLGWSVAKVKRSWPAVLAWLQEAIENDA